MRILKASGFIDFYISKKKYESYSRTNSRNLYVERMLLKYLDSLVGKTIDGLVIRDCSISNNSFWNSASLVTIPDLGYNFYHTPPRREDDKLPLRIFDIDLIGVIVGEREEFFTIQDKNFILKISGEKII